MTAQPSEFEELSNLTWRYHEGLLTDSEAARLEELVLQNRDARIAFVQWASMVAEIQSKENFETSKDLAALVSPGGQGPGREGLVRSFAFIAAGTVRKAANSLLTRPHFLSLAAALLIGVGIWGASSLVARFGATEAIGEDSRPAFSPAVARLTRLVDAQWGSEKLRDGAFLRCGERLELVSGFAEITYKNGIVVLLEGPTNYVLPPAANYDQVWGVGDQACAGYLDFGRLSVQVPASAGGMVISSLAGSATNFSGEFGMAVGGRNDITLAVFEGAAEMKLIDRFGGWKQRVEANASVRFDPREISPIIANVESAGPFVRRLPDTPPPLMLHWEFNAAADDGKLLLDRSGQGRHGRFVGNAGRVTLVPGPEGFGQALALNGIEEIVELAEPQWSRLDDSFEQFTVAMWVRPEGSGNREVFVCGKMGAPLRRGWQLCLTADTRLPRLVFFRSAADNLPTELIGNIPLPLNKFSHLAMIFEGGESARLYVNGHLAGELTQVPPRMNGANRVNFQVGNRGDGFRSQHFEGAIDDVRIYQMALTSSMLGRLIDAKQLLDPAFPAAVPSKRKSLENSEEKQR
jgi:hypothetical protein